MQTCKESEQMALEVHMEVMMLFEHRFRVLVMNFV
jgi:hypothetical protein